MRQNSNTAYPRLSRSFLERLRKAYGVWLEGFTDAGESMWTALDDRRNEIHLALIGDGDSLTELLTHPRRTQIYYGVDDLFDHGSERTAEELTGYSNRTKEILYDFCFATGLCRFPNPEGGVLYQRRNRLPLPDIEAILNALDIYCGAPVEFPNPFPDENGLMCSRGVISERAIFAIYQAFTLRKISSQGILEIGAGMGRTAYYSHRFGLTDYTIVDLPLTLVGQAIFLCLTLGEDAVCFGNEPSRIGSVNLLSPRQLEESTRQYKIVLNVDSMPEMDRRFAEGYVARMMNDGAYFISINHEANRFTVNEIAPMRSKVFRAPFTMRPGYVEEHYRFN